MTTIGMHYDVIPGKNEAFEQRFGAVLQLMKTFKGHVESQLYRDVHKAGIYLIISEWRTKEAFGAFIESDPFKETVKWGREQILRSRPRHKVFGE